MRNSWDMSKTFKGHCFAHISVISDPFRLFLVLFWRVSPPGCGYGCARVWVRVGVELPMGYPWHALYILSKLVLDVCTVSYLWYLHGFLQETMCTTYMPPVVQSVFLPSWFPTGNHMHYIPHYAWDPHDHHSYLPCTPLFKQTFRLLVP